MSKGSMYANQKETLARPAQIPKELLKQFGEGLMAAEAIEDASAVAKKKKIEETEKIVARLPYQVDVIEADGRPSEYTGNHLTLTLQS